MITWLVDMGSSWNSANVTRTEERSGRYKRWPTTEGPLWINREKKRALKHTTLQSQWNGVCASQNWVPSVIQFHGRSSPIYKFYLTVQYSEESPTHTGWALMSYSVSLYNLACLLVSMLIQHDKGDAQAPFGHDKRAMSRLIFFFAVYSE